MENITVYEVFKVYIKDLETSTPYYVGGTSNSTISKSISQEFLRGDWGNRIVDVIQTDNQYTFSVTPIKFSSNQIAIAQGGDYVVAEADIPVEEFLTITSGKVTIKETPSGDVTVFSQDGEVLANTALDKDVTVTGGDDGQKVVVRYMTAKTDVKVLDLKVDQFPKSYEVILHTIGKASGRVRADIVWVFDNAIPDGNFESGGDSGTNQASSTTFTAMDNGNGSYGKQMIYKRP